MHYGHSPEKAKIYSSQALTLIDRSALPRRPDIFELFYVYVSAQLPEVVRALDKIFEKGVLPNEADCSQIYKLHISGGLQETAVLNASDKVQETIGDVKQIVAAIQESTAGYGDSLSGINESLSKATKLEDVTALVKEMMSNTASIITKNQELETQLERSSSAITSMQSEIETVRREAMTDGLTGLANRKAFDRKMDEAQKAFAEQGKIFSLLVMDLDHFKSFNDTYGHQVGDRVLKLLARVLQDHITDTVFAARFGGEEFVVVADGHKVNEAAEIAESIRTKIAEKDIVNKTSGERLGKVTISIGAAEIIAGESVDGLIERADKALYMAKGAGRNRVITDLGGDKPAAAAH